MGKSTRVQIWTLIQNLLLPNGGTKEVSCYVLTKTECLYIVTKFNYEARTVLCGWIMARN